MGVILVGLINRETELEELRELAQCSGANLAVLYGRRRIGKTFLLNHIWQDERVFYYLASETSSEFNRYELARNFIDWSQSDAGIQAAELGTWRLVFREIFRFAESRNEPLVMVLDEFQYLLGGDDDIRSQFVAVWDRLETETPILVVLSGSAVRTMEQLDNAQAPLYGRLDWKRQIRPFDYWHSAQLSPFENKRKLAKIYGTFGGTPDYLSSLPFATS